MFELVKTTTKDNLILHGLFSEGEKEKPVVLFVHGFRGDFFSEDYVLEIAEKLKSKDISFLTVQNRGTASDYVINTTDKSHKRYGSDFEVLKEAHLDIDGWIDFLLERGFKNIVLCGHSLGTLKVVRYMIEGKYIKSVSGLILLAPPDNIALTEVYTKGKGIKYLKDAVKKVKERQGEEMTPSSFLDVVISFKTYASWHTEGDLSNIFSFHKKGYTFPILNKIKIPVMAAIGTKDEFLEMAKIGDAKLVMDKLRNNIGNFTGYILEGADHEYKGFEKEVAGYILDFVQKLM